MPTVFKVPRSLHIGPYVYKVRSDAEAVTRCEAAGAIGLCGRDNHRIDVQPDLKQPAKTKVILHEVLHAVDDQYNDGKCCEDVDHLAKGFTQVFEQMGIRLDV
jgi:hypothetical protein